MLDELDEDEEKEEAERRSIEQIEIDARKDVEENFDRYFNRIKKLKRTDRLSTYLNSITNIYDPHTGYFEPIDRENFDISMSGTLEGIGASLQTDGDLTKVVRIVPGGPAWKQKDLDKDDYILKVAQDEEDPIDVTGMSLNDVIQMIRGPKGTKVSLTVKKVDGTIKVITIERDVVILEEGYARSLMLKDEDGEGGDPKIGYIYLPKFYADFGGNGGPSCSEDVEKEIKKLKAAGAEGIILDLRNNGGGSLRDVVDMAGLFIEEGPVVQVKARGREPAVLSDRDPDVQYDGPLVVMVNHFSASASEILAAALQDYDRAVIIGSNSTYGKGTVQRFLDLDRLSSARDVDELGQIKLTIQKFYRINGGSTQLRGVTPDIILPDNYHLITTGEKENDYPMSWSEIPAVPYQQNVSRLNYLKKLQKNSEGRVKSNETFSIVLENAERLKEQRDETSYPLDFEAFKAKDQFYKEEAEKYNDIFKPIGELHIENLEVDVAHIQSDSSRIARNDDWVSRIQKDIYVEEALEVMEDMIQYN